MRTAVAGGRGFITRSMTQKHKGKSKCTVIYDSITITELSWLVKS